VMCWTLQMGQGCGAVDCWWCDFGVMCWTLQMGRCCGAVDCWWCDFGVMCWTLQMGRGCGAVDCWWCDFGVMCWTLQITLTPAAFCSRRKLAEEERLCIAPAVLAGSASAVTAPATTGAASGPGRGRPAARSTLVHGRIVCDACGAAPVTGARAVCTDFALCEACEGKHHDALVATITGTSSGSGLLRGASHPFLKIATPSQTPVVLHDNEEEGTTTIIAADIISGEGAQVALHALAVAEGGRGRFHRHHQRHQKQQTRRNWL